MKKNYLYSLLGVVLLLATVLTFLPDQLVSEKDVNRKELTSEQIIANRKQAKIDRRAAGYAKQDKPDKFLEYIHLLKTGGDPTRNYPFNYALKELKGAQFKSASLKSAKGALDWKQRGPGNVGGRTRGFIVDPDDLSGDTWFAGPVGGGVWKTVDAGQTWTSITPDWPNLSVGCLVMAPSDHQVIYAGTGEGFGNMDAITGNGIFKTTNKGQTWDLLTGTANDTRFKYVNRMAVNPTDENDVIAATNTGIFKTYDGGLSWDKVYENIVGKDVFRIQDLRVHPENFDIQFASVNGKGILSSIDGGDNWKMIKSITEGRIELAFSTNFPDTLFALTAESNLYLSTDGGDNWAKTTAASNVKFLSGQGWYNNTLVGHPKDAEKLFVGGIDIYRVSLGGENSGDGTNVYDVTDNTSSYFTYSNFDGQYLGGGVNATLTNAELLRNVEVQFGSGKTQKAHRFTVGGNTSAVVANDQYIYQDYVSVPFKVVDAETGNQLMVSFRDQDENGKFNIGTNGLEQYFIHSVDYNETIASVGIAVDGGVEFSRILSVYPLMTQGKSWDAASLPELSLGFDIYSLKSKSISSEQITDWRLNPGSEPSAYAHADHHNLIVVEHAGSPFRLINCNDGGIALSDNGGSSWSDPISGYVTTQFYGVSKHPSKDQYFGGTQDNGTWLSGVNPGKMSQWSAKIGGDGFETVWHAKDANKFAGSLYNNGIHITYDGGDTWNAAGIGDNDDESAPFVTRIANAYSNPDFLMVGGLSGIWKSDNFGKEWSLTTMPDGTWFAGNYNPQIAICAANSKIIWAGNAISADYSVALSTDGGKTFVKLPAAYNVAAYISDIVAHPSDEKSAFVLFAEKGSPKIIKTADLGQTWTDISGFGSGSSSTTGFPDVAVYSLVVMPHDTNILWAGTEIGLFESTDGGLNWHYADNGLPAVCIWDMKIVGQQVIVGTHGLGVWTVDIPEIPSPVDLPLILAAAKKPGGDYLYTLDFYQSYERVELFIDDQLELTLENVTEGRQNLEIKKNIAKSEFSTQMMAYNGDALHYSNYKWVSNPSYEQPIEMYLNAFSDRQNDFRGDLTVSNELFSNAAIHSDHPYAKEGDFIYTLNYPIVVMDDPAKAKMVYRDIAFVEPGSSGTKFGDAEYWDYVVVEGTKDGINWLPLSDGYDVNYSSKWSGYAGADLTKVPNSESLYESHTIDLHDVFTARDTLLIRFRLYSDQESVGWGWIIDDVCIQNEGTGLFNPHSAPEGTLTLAPNPVADDFVRVRLEADAVGEVMVSIYSVNGKLELSRAFNKSTSVFEESIQTGTVSEGVKIVTVAIQGDVYSQKVVFQ
ncbi:MAG: hypothetical protein JEZ14_10520 [Marinilabiliaceae bacterium]|nr:hypothetical protein [Marinilabiliaceae bacterium]